MEIHSKYPRLTALVLGSAVLSISVPVIADQIILDDLIVDGSVCAGFDCVNGESFGFDTIRIKENNLRIKAQDTSNSASFPTRDWQLTFNDSSNGGANKFSIDDIDGGRTPFTIEAGAPSHSLYVDDGGRLGFGTSTPVVDLHVKSGNTPTLRLEQDGSSGFTAQTWDLAGNESNFFIRDVSNGSTLPVRIRPGAPTSALDIAGSGWVGLSSSSPTAPLDIDYGTAGIGHGNAVIRLARDGDLAFQLNDTTDASDFWNFAVANSEGEFRISKSGTGVKELILDTAGNLTVTGTLTTSAGGIVPDYVFEPDYPLLSLDKLATFIEQERHLPDIPSAKEMNGRINMSELQLQMLAKLEELTLYILAQERTMNTQEESILMLRSRLEALEKNKELQ